MRYQPASHWSAKRLLRKLDPDPDAARHLDHLARAVLSERNYRQWRRGAKYYRDDPSSPGFQGRRPRPGP